MTPVTSLPELLDRLRADICTELDADGFNVPPKARTDTFEAVLALFRIRHRSIIPKPRPVTYSEALQSRVLDESTRAAVLEIEKESSEGADLNPRLTRRYYKAGYDDALFNDLQIQHFHLGLKGHGANGQVGGTKDLLFAFHSPERLYFLDVRDHDAFIHTDFVAILHSNWPNLVSGRVLPGLRPGEDVSPQDRATARRSGVTVLSSIGGRVFLPPGGGVASNGTSSRAVSAAMSFLEKLQSHHEWLVSAADHFAEQAQARGGVDVFAIDVRVRFDWHDITFEDTTLRASFHPRRGR